VRVGSSLHQPVRLRYVESHASTRSTSLRHLMLSAHRQFTADSSEIHRSLILWGVIFGKGGKGSM
jgi:hypothetical protein